MDVCSYRVNGRKYVSEKLNSASLVRDIFEEDVCIRVLLKAIHTLLTHGYIYTLREKERKRGGERERESKFLQSSQCNLSQCFFSSICFNSENPP